MPLAVAKEGQIKCTLKFDGLMFWLGKSCASERRWQSCSVDASNSTYARQQPTSVHIFGVLRAGMRSWLSADQRPCLPLQAILWLDSTRKNLGRTQQLRCKQQLAETEGLCKDISVSQPFGTKLWLKCTVSLLQCSSDRVLQWFPSHTGREKGVDIGCCGC